MNKRTKAFWIVLLIVVIFDAVPQAAQLQMGDATTSGFLEIPRLLMLGMDAMFACYITRRLGWWHR